MKRQSLIVSHSRLDLVKFCPQCGHRSKPDRVFDVNAYGLICPNKHRFFIWKKHTDGCFSAKANTLKLPEEKDDLTVIRNWLRHRLLRSHLNDQLAYFLRRIYEIEKLNYKLSSVNIRFNYCLLCGLDLAPFDQDDCWVVGVQCSNEHQFLLRAGAHFQLDGALLFVGIDQDDETACKMIGWWLYDREETMQRQIHPQIRKVLGNFYKKFCKF